LAVFRGRNTINDALIIGDGIGEPNRCHGLPDSQIVGSSLSFYAVFSMG
jgi:hypothetical protein